MPSALFGELLKAGVRAILISVAIEVALLILAFGIGIGVWVAKGFFSGILAGTATLAIGQVLVIMIIDMTLLLDERPQKSTLEQSDAEVLAALRKELETPAEQAVSGNRR
jgi:hypothetical protein